MVVMLGWRMTTMLSLVAMVFGSVPAVASLPPPAMPQVGAAWLLVIDHQEATQSANRSGSSSGHDALVERVIAVAADGVTYEYDLPPDATSDDRARQWQLPVQLFRATTGDVQIVDVAALERRIDAWLRRARMTRADCGRQIFTWNLFRVDCDTSNAISVIERFLTPREPMAEGVIATHPYALAAGRFSRAVDGSYLASLEIDPEAARRSKAEGAVMVGNITNDPVTVDAATATWARAAISGTIAIRIEPDADGRVYRRVTHTSVVITGMGDDDEQVTATETLTRTPIASARR
jgi:hypothetical protein